MLADAAPALVLTSGVLRERLPQNSQVSLSMYWRRKLR